MSYPARRNFTLIELIAVIAIAAMVLSMAVASLRRSSSAARFDQHIRSFQQFCLTARAQSAELGIERAVVYLPEERVFRAVEPDTVPVDPEAIIPLEPPPDGSEAWFDDRVPTGYARLFWSLPEEFELEAEWDPADSFASSLELFRFFADGGATARGEFRLTRGTLGKCFRISPLTGRLLVEEVAP